MHDFILREIKDTDIQTELNRIGFDKSYAHRAVDKFNYKNIKIYNLTPAQANILKQTAISVGCDCATHREVITGKIEKSNCILGGSISEIKKVGEKLKFQPFGLKILGEKLCHYEEFKGLNDEVIQPIGNNKPDCFAYARNDKINTTQLAGILNITDSDGDTQNSLAPLGRGQGEGCKLVGILNITDNSFSDGDMQNFLAPLGRGQGEGCKLVGILNITDNSFSDGGLYNDIEKAKEHLLEMISDGADIIDIGAESTKPYSNPVNDEEQLKKLLPIIDFAKDKTTISIDTRSAIVAEECLKAGAHIINDVSGFDYDNKMADVIAKYNVPVVIQHSKGTPENMQNSPHYDDVIEEIFLALREKINFSRSKGIENIIIDPGIGFGKTRKNNFEIIRRVEEFKSLGYPIMLGISRKSFLETQDDTYTAIFNALAVERNVDYIRVHNVKMHKNMIDLMKLFMVE